MGRHAHHEKRSGDRSAITFDASDGKAVYWHRELPPFDAEAMGEHVVEATSNRVPRTLAHRDELWNQCYQDLMDQAVMPLQEEVCRLEVSTHTCSTNR